MCEYKSSFVNDLRDPASPYLLFQVQKIYKTLIALVSSSSASPSSSSSSSAMALESIVKSIYEFSVLTKGVKNGTILAKQFANDFKDILDPWVARFSQSGAVM